MILSFFINTWHYDILCELVLRYTYLYTTEMFCIFLLLIWLLSVIVTLMFFPLFWLYFLLSNSLFLTFLLFDFFLWNSLFLNFFYCNSFFRKVFQSENFFLSEIISLGLSAQRFWYGPVRFLWMSWSVISVCSDLNVSPVFPPSVS